MLPLVQSDGHNFDLPTFDFLPNHTLVVFLSTMKINTFKSNVFAPMGRRWKIKVN